MQKQLMEGRDGHRDEAEFARYSPDLPCLPGWSAETAPIDFGDWITCLHTYMSDLIRTSERWWDLNLETAKGVVSKSYMQMMPIQRLSHVISETQAEKVGSSSLLVVALPDQLREEVIMFEVGHSLGDRCKGYAAMLRV